MSADVNLVAIPGYYLMRMMGPRHSHFLIYHFFLIELLLYFYSCSQNYSYLLEPIRVQTLVHQLELARIVKAHQISIHLVPFCHTRWNIRDLI